MSLAAALVHISCLVSTSHPLSPGASASAANIERSLSQSQVYVCGTKKISDDYYQDTHPMLYLYHIAYAGDGLLSSSAKEGGLQRPSELASSLAAPALESEVCRRVQCVIMINVQDDTL